MLDVGARSEFIQLEQLANLDLDLHSLAPWVWKSPVMS
jgi:hypothetical protein